MQPWDRVSAEAALKARADQEGAVSPLAALEARCLVRVILGKVEIPWGVRITQHSDAQEDADQRALAVLTDTAQEEQRNTVWVGRNALSDLVKSHQLAHPDTPTLNQLLVGQMFEERALDGEPGFRIARGWGDCLARGAALLWHRWLRHPPDGLGSKAALLAWLRLTRGLMHCWDVLAYMTATAKSIWLSTALELILEEPDLLGWSNEGERMRWELDHPHRTEWEWSPPYDDPDNAATLAERYFWLEEFEVKHKWLVFRDDARNEINSLIVAIVRYDDDRDVAYVNRCARIRTLLQAGTIRPHLLRVVPFFLCQDRPSALAWLATKSETGSLALNLADRLTGAGTGWDSFPDRLSRSENYRTEIWKELFEVFLIAVRTLDDRALAKAIDECLAKIASRTVEGNHYRPDVGAVHNAAARVRLDYALSALRDVTRGGRRQPTRGARFQDSFLAMTAQHLLALWSDRTRKQPRPDFATFPLAELHLLFWLLGALVKRLSERNNKLLATC